MGFILDLLEAFFLPPEVTHHPQKVLKIKVENTPQPNLVRRNAQPVWVEKHWKVNRDEYQGFYRTRYGACQGKIVSLYGGRFQYFIINPPDCLRNHSHFQCFIHKGGGTYEVHFTKQGKTVDEGILAIEKILGEAHEGKG